MVHFIADYVSQLVNNCNDDNGVWSDDYFYPTNYMSMYCGIWSWATIKGDLARVYRGNQAVRGYPFDKGGSKNFEWPQIDPYQCFNTSNG